MRTHFYDDGSFFLADTFGDGWGTAKLHVYDLRGHHVTYAPNPTAARDETNPLTNVQYCFPNSALLASEHERTFTAAVRGLNPRQSWEVSAATDME